MGYLFLFIFIAVPIIEIALFIQIGSLIGLWPTLATVVLTAVAGTWLLRRCPSVGSFHSRGTTNAQLALLRLWFLKRK